MLPLFPSELFILMGINVFVALSLLTSIFDGPFPEAAPYIFQIAALSGFGQIWINYAFFFSSIETRFWNSLLYLTVTVSTVIAVNLYIAIKKRLFSVAGIFLGVFTLPINFASYFFVSSYVNGQMIPIPPLPTVPVECLYIVLMACIVILGLSILIYYESSAFERMLKAHQKRQHASKSFNVSVNPSDDHREHKKERR
jgi:hypothetical protein